ncbi:hypothetical protein K491DRAFT_271639 [Lophiostoma macrostomum CBS 122681]|uniref:Uncharacterized protein n=1 Tax=Lophiostoma macrostomum CBS 122681 TaxID=1314788 RepID=A0A6A6SJK8_9PLEO|nr:hypothetical protein K491DRAFT_271639 [Lophiostoma macrostomum CBS 122681]
MTGFRGRRVYPMYNLPLHASTPYLHNPRLPAAHCRALDILHRDKRRPMISRHRPYVRVTKRYFLTLAHQLNTNLLTIRQTHALGLLPSSWSKCLSTRRHGRLFSGAQRKKKRKKHTIRVELRRRNNRDSTRVFHPAPVTLSHHCIVHIPCDSIL